MDGIFAHSPSPVRGVPRGLSFTPLLYMYTEVNLASTSAPQLVRTSLADWASEPCVTDYGALLLCRQGRAVLQVNFSMWTLTPGAVISIFPNDVVRLSVNDNADDGQSFEVEMLRYDASLLREASLQLEQTVYASLREDRCQTNSPKVSAIVSRIFDLLHAYLDDGATACASQLVLFQLKAFFMGYHDYLQHHPQAMVDDGASYRVRELFNKFMMLVERDFRLSRDVAYYARQMHITPKYLTTIVRSITRETPKHVIDHYTVLQLKLAIASGRQSMKEIAYAFNFNDTSFLNRYFKRHTGRLPMSLRRRTDDGTPLGAP